MCFPDGTVVKSPPANAGDIRDLGLIPGSRRSPGEGHGNPLQYSCLANPMDTGTRWATVQGVAKSWTQLERLNTRVFMHGFRNQMGLTELFTASLSPATAQWHHLKVVATVFWYSTFFNSLHVLLLQGIIC